MKLTLFQTKHGSCGLVFGIRSRIKSMRIRDTAVDCFHLKTVQFEYCKQFITFIRVATLTFNPLNATDVAPVINFLNEDAVPVAKIEYR
jgi:hypothetical protein